MIRKDPGNQIRGSITWMRKRSLLASFADELAAAPEAQRMNLFLDLHRKMRQSNLVFSSEERDLLFSILTENLSPDGRKKAEMIRRLAGQFPPK